MATSAAVILNQLGQSSLGSNPAARMDAIIKLAGTAAVGESSGRPFNEMVLHLTTVLGANHPVLREFQSIFNTQIQAE